MERKFTKGPWKKMHEFDNEPTYIVDTDGRIIAELPIGEGCSNEEKLANANLIEASPLLFEACELALERLAICNCEGEEDEFIGLLEEALTVARY